MSNGEIDDINAFITDNLDIHQFAQDVIENCEGPDLLRAFWKAITGVTILDPTCGSGAFLFAALNILEPLYEACLDRMEVFLDELEHTRETPRAERFRDFRKVLEDINRHPNRRYFHSQVNYYQQSLRCGHYGGGNRDLQVATLPQNGGTD